jgi:hypothetical protein
LAIWIPVCERQREQSVFRPSCGADVERAMGMGFAGPELSPIPQQEFGMKDRPARDRSDYQEHEAQYFARHARPVSPSEGTDPGQPYSAAPGASGKNK